LGHLVDVSGSSLTASTGLHGGLFRRVPDFCRPLPFLPDAIDSPPLRGVCPAQEFPLVLSRQAGMPMKEVNGRDDCLLPCRPASRSAFVLVKRPPRRLLSAPVPLIFILRLIFFFPFAILQLPFPDCFHPAREESPPEGPAPRPLVFSACLGTPLQSARWSLENGLQPYPHVDRDIVLSIGSAARSEIKSV